MATIDPSIALQVRPVADPLESYGKAVSLKSLANRQRMEEAQFAKFEEDQAAERKLSDLYRANVDATGQINRQGLLSGAASAGLGSRIPGLNKGFAESDKAKLDAQKVGLENKQKGLEYISTYLPKLAANPSVTPQDVINAVAMVPPDVLDPQQSALFVRNLPNDPAALRRFLLSTGQSASDQLAAMTPKFEKIDAGNRVITGTVDPSTGAFTPQGAPTVKAPEGFVVGPNGGLSVDPGFQAAKVQLANAGKSSININNGQKGFENELKLRGDFKQEPVYKAHQEMQSAYSQIKQSLKQGTPAGDLAGATKIMKLLDPGSVVRESELGMAMAATGLLDRAENYASNVINGTKLTPKQRVEFQQLADALYGESVNQFNGKQGEYQKLGADYGLDARRALGPSAEMPKPTAPKKGVVQDGFVFMGGDPSKPESWKRVSK